MIESDTLVFKRVIWSLITILLLYYLGKLAGFIVYYFGLLL